MCAMLLYLSASFNREIGIAGGENGNWLKNYSLNKRTNNLKLLFLCARNQNYFIDHNSSPQSFLLKC